MLFEYFIAIIAAIIVWEFATGGSTPGDPAPNDTDAC